MPGIDAMGPASAAFSTTKIGCTKRSSATRCSRTSARMTAVRRSRRGRSAIICRTPAVALAVLERCRNCDAESLRLLRASRPDARAHSTRRFGIGRVKSVDAHRAAVEASVNAERRAASGAQRAQRSALANDAELALRIVDRLAQKRRQRRSSSRAYFDRQRALADGRHESILGERRDVCGGNAQALQPGHRQNDGVVLSVAPVSSSACRRCRASSRSAGRGEALPAAPAAAGSTCRRRRPPEATPATRTVRCRTRRARRLAPRWRRCACRRAACRRDLCRSERRSRRAARAARSPAP